MVLLEDYKLTPNGLLFGISAVLLLGAVYALHDEQVDDAGLNRSSENQLSMLPIMILPLISAVACYILLESKHEATLAWKHVPMLSLNLGATALALALTPLMLEKTKKSTSHCVVFFALPGFTALLSQQLELPVYLSYVQVLALSLIHI